MFSGGKDKRKSTLGTNGLRVFRLVLLMNVFLATYPVRNKTSIQCYLMCHYLPLLRQYSVLLSVAEYLEYLEYAEPVILH